MKNRTAETENRLPKGIGSRKTGTETTDEPPTYCIAPGSFRIAGVFSNHFPFRIHTGGGEKEGF